MKISCLAQIMGDRLEGKSVGGGGTPSCPLRSDGGSDWSGIGVDGEKWSCLPCRLGIESTSVGYSHQRIKILYLTGTNVVPLKK